eukprot:gene29168-36271_t
MQSGVIQDSQLSASSAWGNDACDVTNGRLLSSGSNHAWCSQTTNVGEWMQVDLGHIRSIRAIATQGRDWDQEAQWVSAYNVSSSVDGITWAAVMNQDGIGTFAGNVDEHTVVTQYFSSFVQARYIRVYPQTYQDWMSMRMELYRCEGAYPYQFYNVDNETATCIVMSTEANTVVNIAGATLTLSVYDYTFADRNEVLDLQATTQDVLVAVQIDQWIDFVCAHPATSQLVGTISRIATISFFGGVKGTFDRDCANGVSTTFADVLSLYFSQLDDHEYTGETCKYTARYGALMSLMVNADGSSSDGTVMIPATSFSTQFVTPATTYLK